METLISLPNGDWGSVIKTHSAYRDVSSLAGTEAYLEHLPLSGEIWGGVAAHPAFLDVAVPDCGTDGAQGEPEPCLMRSGPPGAASCNRNNPLLADLGSYTSYKHRL